MGGAFCCCGGGFSCWGGSCTACTGSACRSSSAFAPGVGYNACCTLSNSVINTTGPSTYVPPDVGGGSGSFPTQLQSVLTTGLSCKVDGLLGEFGLGSFSCLLHVNANQGITPAAAPACTYASRQAASGGLSPGVKSLLVWGAVGAVLVYMFTRKA